MKKYVLLSILFALAIAQACAMQEEQPQSKYYGLGNLFYTLASKVGRNDHLYLAGTGYAWFLRKKIERKENAEDLDRYVPCCGKIMTTPAEPHTEIGIILHNTPLHAAICHGQLECIKLLCAAGASRDKTTKILTRVTRFADFDGSLCDSFEINKADVAEEARSESIPWMIKSVEPEELHEQIQKTLKSFTVGLSAIELAEKFVNKYEEATDHVPKTVRKEICDYFKGE